MRGCVDSFGDTIPDKILYYLTFSLLLQIIDIIVSLSMIVHTLMISLAYPENLNKLIDILYSVVSFDLVQSDSLSTYFFDFNSIENADPLSY